MKSHEQLCLNLSVRLYMFVGVVPQRALISHYKKIKKLQGGRPVTTCLEQQANVRVLAGLKIESITIRQKALVSNGAN